MAIEGAFALGAAACCAWYAHRAGVGAAPFAAFLVVISPLVGEFAVTMAWRYRPSMGVREAAARLFWPSSCDSCARVLTQWDILPVLPYVARGGRCSCKAFKVPFSCTGAGLAYLLASSLVVGVAHARGLPWREIVGVLCVLLAYAPAVVGDIVHGEVDEVLALAPLPVLFVVTPLAFLHAAAGAAGLGLLVLASAVLAGFSRGSLRPFPIGLVDLAIAAGAGSLLDVRGVVTASAWLVATSCASALAVAVASRGGFYGPHEGEAFAFPLVPAIVASVVLSVIFPIVA